VDDETVCTICRDARGEVVKKGCAPCMQGGAPPEGK
jgi:hypothetical protein